MLPDYLKLKEKLKKKINHTMQHALLSHLGPIADAPTFIFFEGNKAIIIREDGSIAEMNPKRMEVNQEIKLTELEGMNHKMVLDKINAMAKEMAEKQAKLFYEAISNAAEEVGNVIDADGQTFSIDMFFEALEKIDRDFDEFGNPKELNWTASPKLFPLIAKVIEQAKTDPEINKRFEALLERKREEWRVRESHRKLVG